ncbi:hypothetical protein F511_00512 [Dorcoceras hygrometricum]|uniref:Glycosyltransferase n=1 Tax=Dorcoceras hygrometricum TaxID=472368 RepID=A0A2Z7BHV0_9LAMI|nr:hypothetical protein F511_00512 [Dorcoceras hygrometricum]
MGFNGGGATPIGDHDCLELGGSNDQNHCELTPVRRLNLPDYYSIAVKITLVFVIIGLSYLLLNQSSYPSQLFQRSDLFSSKFNDSDSEKWASSFHHFASDQDDLPVYTNDEISRLESTLKEATMEDGKTVIITTLNAAWTEPNSIFDLFLESFRIGNQTAHLLDHVVVAALDDTAYARCLGVKLHCFALTTPGVNFTGEAHFMSEDYLKMMWRRIDFLRVVLQLGYNFVFSDADVMWLRDPFPRFYPNADFQIACDHYYEELGSTDVSNSPNGGFNYVKSNNKTIKLYKFWYKGRDYFPGKHDQDVLNMIKMDPYVTNLDMEMRFLNTAYFGGFCEPSKDLDLVITMHANCCIGLENKIHDIQMVIDDWKRYMELGPTGERNSSTRSWTVPRRCG